MARDYAELADGTWAQQGRTFGHPQKAGALIDHHIKTSGPWAPHTVEGALKFLRRTGRPYHLEVKKDAMNAPAMPENAPKQASGAASDAPAETN